MFYIKNGNSEYTFHLEDLTNGNLEAYFPSPKFLDRIDYIQADNDELEYIKNTFRIGRIGDFSTHYTIPISNKQVQTWFGDIAKTILANL